MNNLKIELQDMLDNRREDAKFYGPLDLAVGDQIDKNLYDSLYYYFMEGMYVQFVVNISELGWIYL